MALDPAERLARRRERSRNYARKRRLAKLEATGRLPPEGPRLTADPFKADTIRDPASGKSFARNSEVHRKCLRIAKI